MANESIVFENANGASVNLNDRGSYNIILGMREIFAPSYTVVEEKVPYLSGSRIKNVKANVRSFMLPVQVLSSSHEALLGVLRYLSGILNPEIGSGVITFTATDGTVRTISCVYAGGLHDAPDGIHRMKFNLLFRAFDPYFYEESPTIHSYSVSTSAVPFFPFFPLRVRGSNILSSESINNTGQATVFPIVTILGPGSDPEFENLTTGKSWTIEVTLLADEYLIVDTRQGVKTVEVDGVNAFSDMTDDSELWGFIPGNNSMALTMSGSNDDSTVSIEYYKGYMSL